MFVGQLEIGILNTRVVHILLNDPVFPCITSGPLIQTHMYGRTFSLQLGSA